MIGILCITLWLPVFINEHELRFNTLGYEGRALPFSLFVIPIFLILSKKRRISPIVFLLVLFIFLSLILQLFFSSLLYSTVSFAAFLISFYFFKTYDFDIKIFGIINFLYVILLLYIVYQVATLNAALVIYGQLSENFVIYNYEQYFALALYF